MQARINLSYEKDETKLAALFIYLNKTCFNGLYRVNRKEEFNVPMGGYINPAIFDEDVLRNDSRLLRGTHLEHRNFSYAVVKQGDFYYPDPPYHMTFNGYSKTGFDDNEHRSLAGFCRELNQSNAYFMQSNADTPFIRDLYKEFHIERISACRPILCKGDRRGKQSELIIRNYGIRHSRTAN